MWNLEGHRSSPTAWFIAALVIIPHFAKAQDDPPNPSPLLTDELLFVPPPTQGMARANSSEKVIDAPAVYVVKDLGTLGGTSSTAFGVNASGQVAGSAMSSDRFNHAFITGPDGAGMTRLADGGLGSNGYGINDLGQVTGAQLHAFITGPNGGGLTDIGTLGGTDSAGIGVYTSGQVVGESLTTGNSTYHAFITGPNGVGIRDLGTLGGGYSTAHSINNDGQVAGYSSRWDRYGNFGAFITGPDGTGMTYIGTLGGDYSLGLAINSQGQVTGSAATSGNRIANAFITGPNGVGMTDIGNLGGRGSLGFGINDNGDVVGRAELPDWTSTAFVYRDGLLLDLNALIGVAVSRLTLTQALQINNAGQITAWGVDSESHPSEYHGYLLTPVSLALSKLLMKVQDVGAGESLVVQVTHAQTYYAVPDIQATCAMLTAFLHTVSAQSGKGISQTDAEKLQVDAQTIVVSINCKQNST